LDASETQVADGPVELGDEIEVAVRPSLVARYGAEYEERADPKSPEVVPVGSE